MEFHRSLSRANVGLNWSSLPQYFKNHGYFSSGVGKLYHPRLPPEYDPPSWSDLDKFPFVYPRPSGCRDNTWCAIPPKPTPTFADANSLPILRERLQYAAKNKLPFFLGIGFHKPHLPWRFPEEFLHHYPESADIAPAAHRLPPTGMPSVAWYQCMPQGRFKDVNVFNNISVPLPVDLQQTLRRAYYAATSFMDSLVGEVLAELETLNLANDTIVSFHADHGWQLGEHNEWCKQTNFELATRVPMMIRAPWKKESMGKSTRAFAELVDLYPTLVELAGLPPASEENLDGSSLATLFDNPERVIKNVTLSQYPRCLNAKSSSDLCTGVPREKFDYMGYSMRTDDYRYTEWVKWNGTKLKPEWDKQVGVELYSHVGDTGNDFDAFENENIASKEPDLVKKLSEQLHQIFQKN